MGIGIFSDCPMTSGSGQLPQVLTLSFRPGRHPEAFGRWPAAGDAIYRSSAIADGSWRLRAQGLASAGSGRGIVTRARCLVTVCSWVLVSVPGASSARSAERATCGPTAMARSGPAPAVISSCRAAKAASSPRGVRPTWDGEHRRRTLDGHAQGRPGPQAARRCRLGSRIVTSLVAQGPQRSCGCRSATGSRFGAPGCTFAGKRGAKRGANGDRH